MTIDHPEPPDRDYLDEQERLREEREAHEEDDIPLKEFGL